MGDVLIDYSKYERVILGICGKVLFISDEEDFEKVLDYFTIEETKKAGWTIKELTKEPKKMTVKEVCKMAGEEIEIIKD